MTTIGQTGYTPPTGTTTVNETAPVTPAPTAPEDTAASPVTGDSNATTDSAAKARKSIIRLSEEFKAADKDGNKKLSAAELKMGGDDLKMHDRDGDGVVSKKEFRALFHQQNSFTAMDQNQDGSLSQDEMTKLRRFNDDSYDGDGDGKVSQAEFTQARRAEMKANKRAKIEERLMNLPEDRKAHVLEKFDADKDGQVSVEEVMKGRRARREERQMKDDQTAFESLTSGDKGIELGKKENAKYKAYDANQDGAVSADEFSTGRQADRQAFRDNWFLGTKDKALEERLAQPAGNAQAGEPVNVGSLKDLTYDKALEIVKAQGGELPKPGKPTVLAIRTENAGTREWEDHFVVLKAGGEMQTFLGTTRPHFTTPSGGWNPEMLMPGNYELTPRWKDSKWNNAFLVNDENGNMSVSTVADRNGDGRYSEEEMKQTSRSSEIRLHPGSGGSPSSAGCLNVKDYDAFIKFLGGTEVSFDLTLING